MTNTLFRTARSGVINTARDFSCCVLSARDELVSAAECLPIMAVSGPELVTRFVRETHPELRRGDAFLHNSPYPEVRTPPITASSSPWSIAPAHSA